MSDKSKYLYKHFSISLPIDMYNTLRAIAKSKEHSVSSYIRTLINEDINKYNIDVFNINNLNNDKE
jgi:predicted DNA-binding protein